MHPEAYRGVIWAASRGRLIERIGTEIKDSRVRALDLGGADVNGSARPAVNERLRGLFVDWTGVDIDPADGVDLVLDATKPPPDSFTERPFDLVLCTEVLEHVQDWAAVLCFAFWSLRPGGILLLTAASTGRRPHGARGAMDPEPGEWYKNVDARDLSEVITWAGFSEHGVSYNQNPGDVYAWAVR